MLGSLARRFRLSTVLVNATTPNAWRFASAHTTPKKTDGEVNLSEILKKRFPAARLLDVKDTSSGCGASYEIVVVADEFANMRTVNQHRLVSEALSQQLPNIHAIRIFTGTDEKQFLDSSS